MLAAVPPGEYEARVELDLSPVFGVLAHSETRRIEPPPPDAFERRLRELDSDDPLVRRNALSDLPYFATERKRVGEALVRCLADPDGIVRRMALASLQSRRDVAAKNADAVLAILEDSEGRVRGERTNAALLVSRTTPPSDRALAALEAALRTGTEWEKPIFRSALDFYRERSEK